MKKKLFLGAAVFALSLVSGCSPSSPPQAAPTPENSGQDLGKGKERPKPPPK